MFCLPIALTIPFGATTPSFASHIDLYRSMETTLKMSKRLLPRSINVGEEIGRGAFGIVRKGQWKERLVALKEINALQVKERLRAHGILIEDERILEAIQWEIVCSSLVCHPNVVQFYGAYEDTDTLYLVTELCERGNLEQILKNKEKPITWAERWKWSLESAFGLFKLHQQGIIHRDLKADNILVNQHGQAALADLGVAQVDAFLQQDESPLVGRGVQSRRFKAPEVILNWAESTKESDIYAFGLVLWQIVEDAKMPDFTWGWMKEKIREK